MAFQPFGYKFEVTSPSRTTDVKAIIRERKKGWFDPKNGTRGWICGPFICLWLSAFDRYGPMLFGLIRDDGFGTRISGRAGSDLNGLISTVCLLPLLVFILVEMLTADQFEWNNIAIIGGIIFLALLCFWWAHQERRQAEPLVRFLRDTLTVGDRSRRALSEKDSISEGMTLNVGGQTSGETASAMAIHAALLDLAERDFVILEDGPENYIQTMSQNGSFVVEMRRGPGQHFQATRRNVAATDRTRFHFTFEEARAAFMAFGSGTAAPSMLVWLPMSLPD